MSFLFGNKGPSSAEKIQAVETELEMVSDMFNRYATVLLRCGRELSNKSQTRAIVRSKVCAQRLPGKRPQQRRIRVPRSMRLEVLRRQHEGQREDAKRLAGTRRRRHGWRIGYVSKSRRERSGLAGSISTSTVLGGRCALGYRLVSLIGWSWSRHDFRCTKDAWMHKGYLKRATPVYKCKASEAAQQQPRQPSIPRLIACLFVFQTGHALLQILDLALEVANAILHIFNLR